MQMIHFIQFLALLPYKLGTEFAFHVYINYWNEKEIYLYIP